MANRLDNGKFIYKDDGKYRSNLTIISEKEIPNDAQERATTAYNTDATTFNLPSRVITVVKGKYWVSPKGTHCFEVRGDGAHYLCKEDWGGGGDRGDINHEPDFLYFRRASSNGGGLGNTWFVIPTNYRKVMSGLNMLEGPISWRQLEC